MLTKETHFKDTHKEQGGKKIFHTKGKQNKAVVATFISDKTDFRSKTVRRDKERQYVMIKRSTHQEAITIINIYAPNIRAFKYIKQTLTELKR